MGESEKRYEFALRITNLQSFSAGMRIATSRGGCPAPRNDMQKEGRVRGCKDVVRNDMLKTGKCARVQGRFPAAPRYCANRRQVFACHCEDALGQKRGTFHPCLEVRKPTRFMDVIARSEATRQSVLFAAAQNEKQHFGRIRSSLRVRLKCYFSLPFPAGRTDCHTSVRTGSQ